MPDLEQRRVGVRKSFKYYLPVLQITKSSHGSNNVEEHSNKDTHHRAFKGFKRPNQNPYFCRQPQISDRLTSSWHRHFHFLTTTATTMAMEAVKPRPHDRSCIHQVKMSICKHLIPSPSPLTATAALTISPTQQPRQPK